MKKNSLFLLLCLFLGASACQSPCRNAEQLLRSSQELLQEVKTAKLSYDDPNWEDYDRRLRQLVRECYPEWKTELGLLDKKDFWIIVVRYYYQRYGLGLWRQLMRNEGLAPFIREQIAEWGGNLKDIVQEGLQDLLKEAQWEKIRALF